MSATIEQPVPVAPRMDAADAIASRRLLERAFWSVASLIFLYVLSKLDVEHPLVAITGLAVLITALAPAYLWCSGRIAGWPLLPVMSATYILTFAIPMLAGNSSIAIYTPEEQVRAGLTAVAFLSLTAATGAVVLYRHVPTPSSVLMVRSEIGTTWFLRLIGACAFFQVAYTAGWPQDYLPVGVASIATAVAFTFLTVAAALLSSRLGARELTAGQTRAFALMMFIVVVAQLATLLLVSTMLLAFIMIASFTLARGRPPIRTIIVAAVLLSYFHVGKAAMRLKSWDDSQAVAPQQIPERIYDWIVESGTQLLSRNTEQSSTYVAGTPEAQSLSERASLIQQLLVVQSLTPDPLPYLLGETYAIIPGLLVPRIFWPEKPWAHEGTTIINVYYGRQTRDQTMTTTIGVGLLSESYANFGYFGVGGLALMLGWFYGVTSRWTADAPIHSFRGLVALMLLGAAVQTEQTAGVLVSSLFQGIVALAAIAAVSMRRYPLVLANASETTETTAAEPASPAARGVGTKPVPAT